MIRTDRLALAGGLAVALLPGTFMLATSTAQADPLPQIDATIVSEPRPNKAEVEYRERLQNRDPSPVDSHRSEAYADYKDRQWQQSQRRSKAQIEHDEEQRRATDPSIANERAKQYADYTARRLRENQHRSKAQIEHDERMAGEPQPVAPGNQPIPAGATDGVTGWQLALSTLVGAVAGGGVVAGTRRFRRQPAGAAH
jgi:hypothetical protein